MADKLKILTAADFESRRFKTRDVPAPELGGALRIREFDGEQREAWEMEARRRFRAGEEADMRFARAQMAARVLVDQEGDFLYPPDDQGNHDEETLRRINRNLGGILLDRIYDEAMDLSGLLVRALDDVRKNSESDRNGSGSID